MQAAPRVLLVGEEPLFRGALASIVAGPPLHAHPATYGTNERIIDLVTGDSAELVICDVRAGPMPAPDLVRSLASRYPVLPVMLLGDSGDLPVLADAVESLGVGAFTKDCSLRTFCAGVEAMLAGHLAIGENVFNSIVHRGEESEARGARGVALTDSEREILSLIGQAMPIPSIAATCGISPKTVRNHVMSIYRKLQLNNRAEAMVCAARLGLVPSSR
jgi:DNA-binding NarL/FixJ family response regulator